MLHVCDSDYFHICWELNNYPIYVIDIKLYNDSYDQVPMVEDIEPVPDFSPA